MLELWALENEIYDGGVRSICGVDEAGRGPLAGPVCAAAVVLPRGAVIEGLNDSKKLSEKRREALFDEICDKLKADESFNKAFTEVYADGINQANITNAIQEFEKTLLTPNSRFDKYLKGDKTAMNADEVAGYELFKKYNCATCHVGENMGGQSYELMGIKQDYFADRGTELTIEDNGRYKETKDERDRHRFKVPGLRNIALTAPYYHDATQATLEDAVVSMARYEVGEELSQQEVQKIVAFLKTLTGEYKGKPLTNDNYPETK